MRAPRRRTLRRGGRRAEAPFQGASAALSMATLAGAACVGRHELPCRHTAREFFRGVRNQIIIATNNLPLPIAHLLL